MIISFCGSKSLSVGRCDQNLDQGAKICSIFKVLGLRRKQCHCVCLVFLIPAVYLFSRMESVWRRYRDFIVESKRSNLGVDCTCPYDHVAGRTLMLTWQLMIVAYVHLMVVVQLWVDTCHLWVMLCEHVAQPFGATCHRIIGFYG
jgi:hypothetical protein